MRAMPLPGPLQRVVSVVANPLLVPFALIDIKGTEQIPLEGPAIVVANHRSYFDAVAVALMMARTGRMTRFLGKKEVFDVPLVGRLIGAAGGIRVERGSGSGAPVKAAVDALNAGDIVALMPQGTIPRGEAFFEPELTGRWGAARVASLTKAPVIPVGLWGTEKVWPRSSRVPHVTNVLTPPRVRVRVGRPVDLAYDTAAADTRRIMSAIMDLLPAESRTRKIPTAEELALTLPSEYHGDPRHETERRPGTD
jgi:putative phosphoserine phosphatase / 1-acylglycerol-3-phosphate O-acyltransferase